MWSKTISIYSRGGVPQAYLTPKRGGCSGCARRNPWNKQAEVVPARSATMKQVWRHKQDVSSSVWRRSKIRPIEFITLRTKYGRCMFIIVLRQFWSRGLFFGMLASPKNRGAYVDDQNCRPVWPVPVSGLTGLDRVAGLATPTSLTGDRWVWPVRSVYLESEYN